jgi:YVTN family beta-propeller protein
VGRPAAGARGETVQVYVSRLRRALGDATAELIATRDHGYVLLVPRERIDAHVFETMLTEGREAFAERRYEEARATLGRALGLWRGPPLADFAFDAFAGQPTARLEELRLAALELRVDVDLQLGRHDALVAELDTLTAEHPLRERLRCQQMLALYRAGRQSDALAVYHATRQTLVGELGIEPSAAVRELHDAILRQDRALDVPAAAAPARHRSTSRRSAVAAGVAVACVAVVAAVIALTRNGTAPIVAAPNSVAVIDPARGAVVKQIAVGVRPSDISAGAGGIWVANHDDDSISKIDPAAERLGRTLSTGTAIDGLATTRDAVWTLDAANAMALRIDPTFIQVVKRIRVSAPPGESETVPSPIAAAPGSVWVANGSAAVMRLDGRRGDVAGPPVSVGNQPAGIAVGDGATWVADDLDDTVSEIDRAGLVANTIAVGHGASAIAVGYGGVWVANTADGTVTRIDAQTGAAKTTITVGEGPTGIAVGLGGVWVANSRDGTVSRIDPRSNRVIQTITVGGSPDQVVVSAGRVWATVQAASLPTSEVLGGAVRIVQQKDFNSTDPALMGSYGPQAAQLEYATCAKLLNYPDRAAPDGTHLVPEVAAAMPTVSADGRTYTFTVRPGFRFSSGGPVTARSFRRALERFLSPRMNDPNGLHSLFADVVGFRAYESGRSTRLAGVTATASTLTIRLVRPSPTLTTRIAIPELCAVPADTPVRASGVADLPSAGPYYIASHVPNRELVLQRNPYYKGARPRGPVEIDYRFGSTPDQGTALVQSGKADYANAAIGDPHFASTASPLVKARLTREYGPNSRAARAGRQRYFTNRTLVLEYLILNSRRPLFAAARMRQAINFDVNRRALAQTAGPGFTGLPTDQYLPTGIPGFRDADIYPLGGADVARARALAGYRHRRAVMYTCNAEACLHLAEIVRADLGAIGIDVAIKRLPIIPMFGHEFTRGEPWDIGWFGWAADYPDPSDFIGPPFAGSDVAFPGADEPRDAARVAAVSRLTGERRLRAYGQLDVDLARHAAPVVAFANVTAEDFFSARIGCQVFQPIYGMDLGRLCRRG